MKCPQCNKRTKKEMVDYDTIRCSGCGARYCEEAPQRVLGRAVGLRIGSLVRVSDDWGTQGYPCHGEKLIVDHFTGIGKSVWVNVRYPKSKLKHTYTIYEHWVKWEDK